MFSIGTWHEMDEMEGDVQNRLYLSSHGIVRAWRATRNPVRLTALQEDRCCRRAIGDLSNLNASFKKVCNIPRKLMHMQFNSFVYAASACLSLFSLRSTVPLTVLINHNRKHHLLKKKWPPLRPKPPNDATVHHSRRSNHPRIC
jgi:hypothetical protein